MTNDLYCFFCNQSLDSHPTCKKCKKGYISHRDNTLQESTIHGKVTYYTQHYIFCSNTLCNFSEKQTTRLWL